MSDARFTRLRTDPRFRRPKKAKTKVVVDERFKSIFDADDKKSKRVDKYGRKVSKSADRDNLKRFYRLDGDDDNADGEGGAKRPDFARGEGLVESSSEDEDDNAQEGEDDDDDDDVVVLGRDASKPIRVEEEIDLDEDTIAELDAQAAAYARDAAPADEAQPTTRIAVVNLDWDHIKASHLFKIFSSIDKIRSVRVYPSEFGKERMAKEDREGPPQEVFGNGSKKLEDEDEDDVNERTIFEVNDGEEYNQDALRKYQLERLRYYYAIVKCDSVQAAEHIYSELEGTELERSANVFDLSYVPEDMNFDDDFRDEATEDLTSFKAVDFATDALRHSKVKLTWDADDPERTRLTRRALSRKDLDEIDFKAYIASDSEEEKDEDETRREKMRRLLLREGSDGEDMPDDDELPEGWGTGKPDKAGEMEITFTPGLSSAAANDAGDRDETTLEKYKRKAKEKKAAKKAALTAKRGRSGPDKGEDAGDDDFFGADSDSGSDDGGQRGHKNATREDLEALVAENAASGDGLQHFDMRAVVRADKVAKAHGKLAKKMKKKLERGGHADETGEGFVLDVADERFKAVHEDPAFAIDPSNPKFKKTKGMEALLDERTRRQQSKKGAQDSNEGNLKSLVESVKRKAKARDAEKPGKRRRLNT